MGLSLKKPTNAALLRFSSGFIEHYNFSAIQTPSYAFQVVLSSIRAYLKLHFILI